MEILKETFDRFLQFEKSLFQRKVNGIAYWQLIRETVFFKILREKGVMGEAGPSDIDAGFSKIAPAFLKFILNAAGHVLWRPQPVDILVLTHPRRVRIDDLYVDIYTDPVLDSLSHKYLALEGYHQLQHLRPARTPNLKYLDVYKYPARLIPYFSLFDLNSSDMGEFRQLEQVVEAEFSISDTSLARLASRELLRFEFLVPRMKRLLQKTRPRLLLEVVSYSRTCKAANIAARSLGIPIVELQHGTMGPYHVAYNYPDGIRSEVFPDYLFTWGEFWKETARFPISASNVISTGFPFFESEVAKSVADKRSKTRVLVISQGTIGDRLANLVLEMAARTDASEIQFVFKLHPAEYAYATNKYERLYSAPRVTVVDSDRTKLYDLFAMCTHVIGTYSTAIVEAIGFGLVPIIAMFPGWEYFEALRGRPGVYFVQNAEDALQALTDDQQPNLTQELRAQFWLDSSLRRTLDSIELIMSKDSSTQIDIAAGVSS